MSDRTGPWRSSPATKTPTNGGRRYRRTKRSPFEIQRAASVALVAGGLAISGWAVLQLPDEAPSVQATTSSYAKGEKPEFLGKRVPADPLYQAENFDLPTAPTFTLPPKPTFTLPPKPTFTVPFPPTTRVPIRR